MARVLDADGSEHATVGAEDVVASGVVACAEACLCPGVETPVFPALFEVGQEVFEAVSGQEVSNCLRPGGCGVIEVGVKISKDKGRGFIGLEPAEGFLQVGEVVEMGWRKIGPDNGCGASARDKVAAEDVGAVSTGGFNVPVGGVVLGDEGKAALISGGSVGAEDGVSVACSCVDAMAIRLSRDTGFGGDAKINMLDVEAVAKLGKTAVAAILDVIGGKGGVGSCSIGRDVRRGEGWVQGVTSGFMRRIGGMGLVNKRLVVKGPRDGC